MQGKGLDGGVRVQGAVDGRAHSPPPHKPIWRAIVAGSCGHRVSARAAVGPTISPTLEAPDAPPVRRSVEGEPAAYRRFLKQSRQ
jgi:hypothetical protein